MERKVEGRKGRKGEVMERMVKGWKGEVMERMDKGRKGEAMELCGEL
eukprot:COSAG02_NODE_27822_length_602_cov_0.693837_2_plen_47_part_00